MCYNQHWFQLILDHLYVNGKTKHIFEHGLYFDLSYMPVKHHGSILYSLTELTKKFTENKA